MSKTAPSGGRFRRFFAQLGPGLVTGAADDDPSGISTYSVAGAAFGYSQLWAVPFCLPLMASVQLMCARLGMVSGRGLAGVLRRHYPRSVLWGACALLAIANVLNIGADLAGMAEATELVTNVDSLVWTPIYAVVLVGLMFWSSYVQIARIFKWLTLVLFAYVAAAFLARPDWSAVARSTLIPHLEWSRQYLATMVALLGTTISPYLFFWQASQEVEEERAMGRRSVAARRGATDEELRASLWDTLTGMLFSILTMYFIMLTAGATLHAHGQTQVTTARQAAEALRPIAGNASYLLFTLGLIGTGMLGVPVLAGACAYAVAEAGAWRATLDDHPPRSGKFYTVIGVAMVLGLALDYAGFNAVSMLFWAAVVNGVLAPPLVVLIVLINGNPAIMGERVASRRVRFLGWVAAALMGTAALAMFLSR